MNRAARRALGERGPSNPTVELAYLTTGSPSDAFMQSVIRMRDYEMVRTQQLVGVRSRRARSGSIARARNQITTMYARGIADYLWFVDDDMGFPKHALQNLLAVAHVTDRPIVGALCFAHRTEGYDEETNAEFFGMIPTLSAWERDDEGVIQAFNTWADYPRNQLVRIDSTGAACVLIHRSVILAMQEKYGDNWFTQIPHPTRDETFGEDTSFFIRCAEMGYPLHVHTGIKTSHDKGGVFLTEQTYDLQERMRAVLAAEAEGLINFTAGDVGDLTVSRDTQLPLEFV